jgi:WD40 repeat protein
LFPEGDWKLRKTATGQNGQSKNFYGHCVSSTSREAASKILYVVTVRRSKAFLAGFENGSVCAWNIAADGNDPDFSSDPDPSSNDKSIVAAAFDSDDERILAVTLNGTLYTDLKTGKAVPNLITGEVRGATFSPDGQTVAIVSGHDEIEVFKTATGERIRQLQNKTTTAFSPTYSPDGAMLVIPSRDNGANIWSVSTGQPQMPQFTSEGKINSVEFSPNSRLLLTVSYADIATIWFLLKGSSYREQPSKVLPYSDISSAMFTARGSRLVTLCRNRREIVVFDMQMLRHPSTIRMNPPSAQTLPNASDGQKKKAPIDTESSQIRTITREHPTDYVADMGLLSDETQDDSLNVRQIWKQTSADSTSASISRASPTPPGDRNHLQSQQIPAAVISTKLPDWFREFAKAIAGLGSSKSDAPDGNAGFFYSVVPEYGGGHDEAFRRFGTWLFRLSPDNFVSLTPAYRKTLREWIKDRINEGAGYDLGEAFASWCLDPDVLQKWDQLADQENRN